MLRKNRKQKSVGSMTALIGCHVLVLAVVLMSISGVASAAKGGNGGGNSGGGGGGETGQTIPVCITFDDAPGDGIMSDGSTYRGGDKKSKVGAAVGRNMAIVLDSNSSNKTTAGRTVWLDLGSRLGCISQVDVTDLDGMRGADGFCDYCDDDTGPDLPAGRFGTLPSGQKFGFPDRAKLVVRGRDLDGLLVGDTVKTYADLSFEVGGQSWKLQWGPYTIRDLPTYAPGSEPVTVYRADNDTWVVTTTGASTAFLYLDNKQTGMLEHHGQFLVPFTFTAAAITHEETVWGDEPWEIDPGVPPCSE